MITDAVQPALWYDTLTDRWTPLQFWGRAGEPTTLEDAHEQIGSPERMRVVVWTGQRRKPHEMLTLDEARALQTPTR